MNISLSHRISSIIGKLYILYCQNTPNHRGKQKLAQILDSLFGPFFIDVYEEIKLELFLSSSMDLSYTRKETTTFQNKTFEYINKLNEADTFVDIGSNIGFYSVIAAKKVGLKGRVFSFEPSPREFSV
jgi:hypothetical protein